VLRVYRKRIGRYHDGSAISSHDHSPQVVRNAPQDLKQARNSRGDEVLAGPKHHHAHAGVGGGDVGIRPSCDVRILVECDTEEAQPSADVGAHPR